MISTAIIPVAGKGTRMGPVTRVLPKCLFPLVMPDGAIRPVADVIAREAAECCERICFVTSDDQERLLRQYFDGEPDLAGRIEYVGGVEPYGFGWAVYAARLVARQGSVMVFLGDHVHLPAPGAETPARQVAMAFESRGASAMIGMQVVGEAELALVGVSAGEPIAPAVYRATAIVEKPGLATARARLRTPGLPEGRYLAHAGIYAFGHEIFDCLAPLVAARRDGREVGLTEAQQALFARAPQQYLLCRIAGSVHDTGSAAGYVQTMNALAAGRA